MSTEIAWLGRLALLGTERQPSGVPAAGRTGELLARLPARNAETTLLHAAAVVMLHAQAGRRPAKSRAAALPVCASEPARACGGRAVQHLESMLGDSFPDVLPEWLRAASGAGLVVPPELVPGLLEKGRGLPELRPDIARVCGTRGRWLAALNPDWSYAVGATTDVSVWQTGSRAERAALLGELRKVRAEQARALLESTWSEEPAEDRAMFLAKLAEGLNGADEPFLEAALEDRRKEVRTMAADLLARLPGSGLGQRMIARAAACATYEPGEKGSLLRLRAGRPATWTITPPAVCDKALQRDGIEPKPQQGTGEKAWWLEQIIGATPLDTWAAGTGASPDQLVRALENNDWCDAVLAGWKRAALRQRNAAWAEVLLRQRPPWIVELLPCLDAARADEVLRQELEAKGHEALAPALLSAHMWSEQLTRAVMSRVRARVDAKADDWALRSQLREIARRAAPSLAGEMCGGWPDAREGADPWRKPVEDFVSLVQFRHEMLNALKENPAP